MDKHNNINLIEVFILHPVYPLYSRSDSYGTYTYDRSVVTFNPYQQTYKMIPNLCIPGTGRPTPTATTGTPCPGTTAGTTGPELTGTGAIRTSIIGRGIGFHSVFVSFSSSLLSQHFVIYLYFLQLGPPLALIGITVIDQGMIQCKNMETIVRNRNRWFIEWNRWFIE